MADRMKKRAASWTRGSALRRGGTRSIEGIVILLDGESLRRFGNPVEKIADCVENYVSITLALIHHLKMRG